MVEQNHGEGGQTGTPYGLQDIEQIRLLLEGHSVVDWRRLALRDLAHVDQLLSRQGLDLSQPVDLERLNRIHEPPLFARRKVLPPAPTTSEATPQCARRSAKHSAAVAPASMH